MLDVDVLSAAQLRLACKAVSAEELLVRIPGPDPDDIPHGKIAFYSHSMDNLASQGVARSLGLIPFIDSVGYL